MNKTELIAKVAEMTGTTKKEAEQAVVHLWNIGKVIASGVGE